MKVLIGIFYLSTILFAQSDEIFKDNFDKDLSNWVIEQRGKGKVFLDNGKLRIIDEIGCTIWLKKELKTGVSIEYDVILVSKKGKYDRVSDMNCFWMASDPKNKNFFASSKKRAGLFSNYDPLKLYYVGYGGHNNSKTRFRRYTGQKTKPLLPEHDLSDNEYLNKPNRVMKIKIISNYKKQLFYVNSKLIFKFYDKEPYTSGFFGFRTIRNHMLIDNFRVNSIK